MKLISRLIQLITISIFGVLFADQTSFQFEIINTRDGLSDNEITSVTNDGRGFLWLGTKEGLNRYDGYEVTVYNSNPFDTTALSGNRIWDIYKDRDGDIWSLTDKSLDLYIYGINKFKRYSTGSKPTFVTQDLEGLLWVATESNGLFSINKKTGNKKNYVFKPSDPYSISSSNFDSKQFNPIVIDTSGNVWVGTVSGLNYYRKDKDFFQRFMSSESNLNTVSNNRINTLLVQDNEIYIGTPSGLDKINTNDFSINRLAQSQWFSPLNQYSVNKLLDFGSDKNMVGFWVATTTGMVFYNGAYQMFEDLAWDYLFGQYINNVDSDSKGNLWIDVVAFTGLIHFNTENFFQNSGMFDDTDFTLLQPSADGSLTEVDEPQSVANANINDLFIDSHDNLWVGTQLGLNHLINTSQNFNSITKGPKQLKGENVRSVLIDDNQNIWISHENGIDKLSKDMKPIKTYTSDPTNKNSLLSEETSALAITSDGLLWAGSQYEGLTIIDTKRNRFSRFNAIRDDEVGGGITLTGRINTIYQSENIVWLSTRDGIAKVELEPKQRSNFSFSVYRYDLYPDKEFLLNATSFLSDANNNEMWIGTETNGLFRINAQSMEEIAHYILDKTDEKSFSSFGVKTIHQDKNGVIWIGTPGEGLYRYNNTANNFDRWSVYNGLPSNTVSSIISDHEGTVWMGTRRGITRLLSNGNLQSFEISDGLPSEIFNDRSIDISKDGKLIFGSVSGLTAVDPSSVITNSEPPILAVSSIDAIDYEGKRYSINFGGDKFSVDHNIQSININFVGLTYNKTEKNQYQYTMDNYLNNWVDNGNSRSVTFQGLDDGDYAFKFKASNNDGIWNESPYIISMVVTPPIWDTWYAYIFYVFLTIGLGYLSFTGLEKFRTKRREDNRKDQELEEAREFQLKMIAKEIPDYAGMDIKAYMRTSTEVGGDYYDFFELEDGSFYVVCGDATGHGAQSGMMVSITKAGLAGIVSNSPDDILNRLNTVVRRVDTGRLRMSLSVCIFKENKLYISAAAMPPAYLYSGKNGSVEEIEIHNLPLGGLDNEKFDLVERDFNHGDLLLLLSDGLPEAPDPDGKLLDYPAVQECVEKHGHLGASPLKEALIKLADEWLNGTQNPDDITFVVLEKGDFSKKPTEAANKTEIKKVASA